MIIIKYINKLRGKYLTYRTRKVVIPDFKASKVVRKRFVFSGKVQNVGFRLETHEIGKCLGLKGWVMNKEDRTVEAEVQGEVDRINYLIDHLKSLRRASVKEILEENQDIIEEEGEFRAIY